ncbi:MAG: serine dehydratase subunit alpha family protein, partial [Clostridia bacterium]|nr:serine dehydratase subunit alpha family protein [Clostridia bacterium]
MHELTAMIRADMKPALGVTEPGAIAFCTALAKSYLHGELRHLDIRMNSGMYKNAFTCGIPHSQWVGAAHAAALGFCAGKPEKGLEALSDITAEDDKTAHRYVEEKRITTEISEISSRIYIQATLNTTEGEAVVSIRDSHTNVTFIEVNGSILLKKEEDEEAASASPLIHRYTFRELLEFAQTVPPSEIRFVLEAHRMNLTLFHEGLSSPRTVFSKRLFAMNGGIEISNDERRTASLLCNGAIEARVIGLEQPAMSITGSGAHGIIATLPLYAVYKINRLSEEQLCRATML